MDSQQQQRMNRAAQEFTDALLAAYRTTSENTAVAQQLGAQQIEYFFNTAINNLRTQAEGTLQLTQQLASQQRSEEHTSELQSRQYLVCRLLLEQKQTARLLRRLNR